jgi:hypothetical protein
LDLLFSFLFSFPGMACFGQTIPIHPGSLSANRANSLQFN